MNKLIFLLPLLFVYSFINPFFGSVSEQKLDNQITVCHTVPFDDMRQFALDPEFQALHPAPIALDYDGMGEKVSFKTADGVDGTGYFIKAKKKSDKWLLVYQEWWGLNEYIVRQSDIFYKDLVKYHGRFLT